MAETHVLVIPGTFIPGIFIKDRVNKGEVSIRYCPANVMLADFYTKPLQGNFFNVFRRVIMG